MVYTCPYCTESKGVGISYGYSTFGLEPSTREGFEMHLKTCIQRPATFLYLKDLRDWISRVARSLIRLSRRVTEHVDKTSAQMNLIYGILEKQNVEIEELRARIAQSEHSPCKRDVAGIPAPGSTYANDTSWGTLVG